MRYNSPVEQEEFVRRAIVIYSLILTCSASCITVVSQPDSLPTPLSTAAPAPMRQVTHVSTVMIPASTTPAPIGTLPPTPTFLPTVPTYMVGPTLPTVALTADLLPTLPPATAPALGLTGITPRLRELFQRGQELGNRAGVFSKVGDSLTVATFYLYPIGWGEYNLRAYADLQPVVNFFSTTLARDANSFANTSLAADNGWTTRTVLDPQRANPMLCQPGEIPLTCEYRWSKPSLSIILLGTNDVGLMDGTEYARHLQQIVEITLDRGIIPILTTLPNRLGYDVQVVEFNRIIVETARKYEVPLSDYGTMMYSLPNGGLAPDGVHPSWPPGKYSTAADLTPQNLRYGYTLRNLMTLQTLAVLWQQVLTGS